MSGAGSPCCSGSLLHRSLSGPFLQRPSHSFSPSLTKSSSCGSFGIRKRSRRTAIKGRSHYDLHRTSMTVREMCFVQFGKCGRDGRTTCRFIVLGNMITRSGRCSLQSAYLTEPQRRSMDWQLEAKAVPVPSMMGPLSSTRRVPHPDKMTRTGERVHVPHFVIRLRKDVFEPNIERSQGFS